MVSSRLAIAAVTATLQSLLQAPAHTAVPGAQVRTLRPDLLLADRAAPGVNVFLYRVAPNASLRNAHLPTRRADGSLIQPPCVALDLAYVLSFLGSDELLEPQRLLGACIATLNAWSLLPRSEIAAAVNSSLNGILAGADLADQIEQVKLNLVSLSTEEMSRLWNTFGSVPYQLSVIYEVSVVLVEADLTAPLVLPVQQVVIDASPALDLPVAPPVQVSRP